MAGTLWIALALLALVGGFLARGRRHPARADEPWRQSLDEDDEPLDIEEIRRAEQEWEEEDGGWQESSGDDWR